jgi:exonuclease VII small subunit
LNSSGVLTSIIISYSPFFIFSLAFAGVTSDIVILLLLSKNLVKLKVDITTPEELAVLEESLNYVNDDIDFEIDDFEDLVDDSENENESEGLGLNSFINKLKGGRRLRRRMRKMMAKQRRQLSDSLTKADPNGKVADKTIKKQKIQAYKDEIAGLEQLVISLEEEILVLAIKLPSTAIAINKKKNEIVDSKKRIQVLKEELGKLK